MSILNPANAACIAVILAAVGVEIQSHQIQMILEAAGAVIGVIGIISSFFRGGSR